MTFRFCDIFFVLFVIVMVSGLAGFCFWVGSVWKEKKMLEEE